MFSPLAQLEVEIIKTLERNDLIRFYDHYISPHSIHRRKLSLHVNPSSLANIQETTSTENDDETASNADEEISPTAEISHEAIKLTEQPPIIDSITETNSKENEIVSPKKEINLPKV